MLTISYNKIDMNSQNSKKIKDKFELNLEIFNGSDNNYGNFSNDGKLFQVNENNISPTLLKLSKKVLKKDKCLFSNI